MKRTDIEHLLAPNLVLGDPLPGEPGGIMDRFGYGVFSVETGNEVPDGYSEVAIAVDVRGSTEVLHVVGNAVMQLTTLHGQGELMVYYQDGQRFIHDLQPGREPIVVGPGDTYQYVHAGGWLKRDPLIVLDRSNYQPGDELSLEEAEAEAALQEDTSSLLWSPRKLREAHLAGAWLLGVEDFHDTTAQGLARADIRGYRTDPPHWHATIRRVGESALIPVNVRLVDGAYQIDRRRIGRARTGADESTQTVTLQENSKIFCEIKIPA